MALEIRNISINLVRGQMQDVNVYFGTYYDMDVTNPTDINGSVVLDIQTYLQNQNVNDLINIVSQRIVEAVQTSGGETPQQETVPDDTVPVQTLETGDENQQQRRRVNRVQEGQQQSNNQTE